MNPGLWVLHVEILESKTKAKAFCRTMSTSQSQCSSTCQSQDSRVGLGKTKKKLHCTEGYLVCRDKTRGAAFELGLPRVGHWHVIYCHLVSNCFCSTTQSGHVHCLLFAQTIANQITLYFWSAYFLWSSLHCTGAKVFWPQQAHNAVVAHLLFWKAEFWQSENRAPGYTRKAFMLIFSLGLWNDDDLFLFTHPDFPVSMIPPLHF